MADRETIQLAEDRQPWEQQPGEPDRWFTRFDRFRLMGPRRSLLGCLHEEEAEFGRNRRFARVPGSWCEQSSKWSWWERAVAWDRAESARVRMERQAEIEEARKRAINYGRLMQKKGFEALKEIKPDELSVSEAMKLLLDGVDLETKALTEPEVQELQRLLEEATNGVGGKGSS